MKSGFVGFVSTQECSGVHGKPQSTKSAAWLELFVSVIFLYMMQTFSTA